MSERDGSYRYAILLAVLFAGLAILFISVLRQRMLVAQTDRYTKEIKR